jgi:hypothetical protein
MACDMESVVSKHPQTVGMEFRWKIRSMLEKSKACRSGMTTMELKAMKSLRHNKVIRILQTDKGNGTVVLDESKYNNKLNTLLESGVYEHLSKDPTPKAERKIQKLLSKHKTGLPTDLKHMLTLYHSKPRHLYGLPKVHNPEACNEFCWFPLL